MKYVPIAVCGVYNYVEKFLDTEVTNNYGNHIQCLHHYRLWIDTKTKVLVWFWYLESVGCINETKKLLKQVIKDMYNCTRVATCTQNALLHKTDLLSSVMNLFLVINSNTL